jgi:hypothetical protein
LGRSWKFEIWIGFGLVDQRFESRWRWSRHEGSPQVSGIDQPAPQVMLFRQVVGAQNASLTQVKIVALGTNVETIVRFEVVTAMIAFDFWKRVVFGLVGL